MKKESILTKVRHFLIKFFDRHFFLSSFVIGWGYLYAYAKSGLPLPYGLTLPLIILAFALAGWTTSFLSLHLKTSKEKLLDELDQD